MQQGDLFPFIVLSWRCSDSFNATISLANLATPVSGQQYITGLILGLCLANERWRHFVTTTLIGRAQA